MAQKDIVLIYTRQKTSKKDKKRKTKFSLWSQKRFEEKIFIVLWYFQNQHERSQLLTFLLKHCFSLFISLSQNVS